MWGPVFSVWRKFVAEDYSDKVSPVLSVLATLGDLGSLANTQRTARLQHRCLRAWINRPKLPEIRSLGGCLMSSAPVPGAPARRFLLGLFIVGQLVFLLVGNLVPFVLSALSENWQGSRLPTALAALGSLSDGWVQLSGQGQVWRLFAPQVQTRALFVRIETESPAPGVRSQLASCFEPDASGWYLHLPGGGDRLFLVESELVWPLVAWDPDLQRKEPEQWYDYLVQSVRAKWRAYRTYLAWRTSKAPRAESVELSIRIYSLSLAGRPFDPSAIVTLALLRWRPDLPTPEGFLPLELYDERTGKYQWIPAGEAAAGP
jgi:hypothetical protein